MTVCSLSMLNAPWWSLGVGAPGIHAAATGKPMTMITGSGRGSRRRVDLSGRKNPDPLGFAAERGRQPDCREALPLQVSPPLQRAVQRFGLRRPRHRSQVQGDLQITARSTRSEATTSQACLATRSRV